MLPSLNLTDCLFTLAQQNNRISLDCHLFLLLFSFFFRWEISPMSFNVFFYRPFTPYHPQVGETAKRGNWWRMCQKVFFVLFMLAQCLSILQNSAFDGLKKRNLPWGRGWTSWGRQVYWWTFSIDGNFQFFFMEIFNLNLIRQLMSSTFQLNTSRESLSLVDGFLNSYIAQ